MEMKYSASQVELHEVKNLLSTKENEVLKLQREVHKLKVSNTYFHYFRVQFHVFEVWKGNTK